MGGNCAVTVEEKARKESNSDAVTRLEDVHESPFLRSNFILIDHGMCEDERVIIIDVGVDMGVSRIMSGVDVETMLADSSQSESLEARRQSVSKQHLRMDM